MRSEWEEEEEEGSGIETKQGKRQTDARETQVKSKGWAISVERLDSDLPIYDLFWSWFGTHNHSLSILIKPWFRPACLLPFQLLYNAAGSGEAATSLRFVNSNISPNHFLKKIYWPAVCKPWYRTLCKVTANCGMAWSVNNFTQLLVKYCSSCIMYYCALPDITHYWLLSAIIMKLYIQVFIEREGERILHAYYFCIVFANSLHLYWDYLNCSYIWNCF